MHFDNRDEQVLDAAVRDLSQHAQPEFGAIDRKEAIDPNLAGARIAAREARRRVVFRSVDGLKATIVQQLDKHNADPKPFAWTATPTKIMEKSQPPNASAHHV